MTYTPPWQRSCNCRCLRHLPRTTDNEPNYACTITCATQPLTLLADHWDCALFLDPAGDLWHVPTLTHGTWDRSNAAEINTRSDLHDAGRLIEQLLRHVAQVLAAPLP
ncbi:MULTISPECIES: hypothetical protein [unclassified Micromonospora]|uniref:hypothetical protein n=1 Tax=unclassified Micromonospora TaxID=2617518 RepID=UPI00098D3977|nr:MULTISPECIES: hypothetical protein [unclassified Micromonospora]MDI5941451.1 hypothetical protein [Micromonospora sp. DH15]OON28442.1 hypothetical protein BSA16_26810 [Micromonospora sp. Rc5]